jgi:hypothetical protein
MEIKTFNVNHLFSEIFWKLRVSGVEDQSRNGPVLRFPEPVLTTILNPRERVLFHAGRDANPIFHCLEAIHMLAGRRDVAFLKQFNSRIPLYSDDGVNFNAAYGYRMRNHFGKDQLAHVIDTLKNDPGSRQAVVQLWDAADLGRETKDKACNTQMIFAVNRGKLELTVTNRSNDIFWGYAGANAVHFTIIQEFVAAALGLEVGPYRTFSTNLHLYTELYNAVEYLESPPDVHEYNYYDGPTRTTPIVQGGSAENWLRDAEEFCEDPYFARTYWDPFFLEVAHPMAMVSLSRKRGGTGLEWVQRMQPGDWKLAVAEWVERRELKSLKKSTESSKTQA